MFEDFTVLHYWKTKHKIKKICEMITRLGIEIAGVSATGSLLRGNRFASLSSKLEKIDKSLENASKEINKIDEQLEEQVRTSKKADLIISSITYETKGGVIVFYITVKNVGTEIAGASVTELLIGNNKKIYSIPSLGVNESYTFNAYQANSGTNIQEFTVVATADKFNQVEETNENNNIKRITVEAKIIPNKAYVMVHCHNPEGFEINSIEAHDTPWGFYRPYDAKFVVNGHLFFGAATEAEHLRVIQIPANVDIEIIGSFNGMQKYKTVNLEEGVTEIVEFVFERTNFNLSWDLSASFHITRDHGTPSNPYTEEKNGCKWSGYVMSWPNVDIFDGAADDSISLNTSSFEIISHKYLLEASSGDSVPVEPDYWLLELNGGIIDDYYLASVAIDILPCSTFIKWYSQFKTTENYPVAVLNSESASQYTLIFQTDGIYGHAYFPANVHYTQLSFINDSENHSDKISYTHPRWPYPWHVYPNLNSYAHRSGTLDVFKCSSVPYNIDGKAI